MTKILLSLLIVLVSLNLQAQRNRITYDTLNNGYAALYWKNLTIVKMDSMNLRDPEHSFQGEAVLHRKVKNLKALKTKDLRRSEERPERNKPMK